MESLKLKRGLVLPGLSGSPLLDLGSGLVSGITESTRGRQADLGGFAVSVSELEAFPGLVEASRAFHDGDDRWRSVFEAEKVYAAQRAGERDGSHYVHLWWHLHRMRICRRQRYCDHGTPWWAS